MLARFGAALRRWGQRGLSSLPGIPPRPGFWILVCRVSSDESDRGAAGAAGPWAGHVRPAFCARARACVSFVSSSARCVCSPSLSHFTTTQSQSGTHSLTQNSIHARVSRHPRACVCVCVCVCDRKLPGVSLHSYRVGETRATTRVVGARGTRGRARRVAPGSGKMWRGTSTMDTSQRHRRAHARAAPGMGGSVAR